MAYLKRDRIGILFYIDKRTDQNEQLQLNDALLEKTQMFYPPPKKKTPILWLDLVHTLGLTQVLPQAFVHCAGPRLLDGVASSWSFHAR